MLRVACFLFSVCLEPFYYTQSERIQSVIHTRQKKPPATFPLQKGAHPLTTSGAVPIGAHRPTSTQKVSAVNRRRKRSALAFVTGELDNALSGKPDDLLATWEAAITARGAQAATGDATANERAAAMAARTTGVERMAVRPVEEGRMA